MNAIRWVISLIYIIQNAVMMLILGIVFFPWAIFSPKGARMACRTYAGWALWTAKWMLGLRHEVRGSPPTDEVMIAAKHQSFMDIMIIFYYTPAAKFIMKRELLWTPIIGVYAYRLGCVPVNRGKRGQAIKKMIEDVQKGRSEPGQLVIYSQGTRVRPGEDRPYKIGTYALYEQLAQPCVPAATNAGLFWPKGTILRKPGLAVVEFLEPIPTGVAQKDFMQTIEREVEAHSNALMRESGFDI